MKKKIAIYTSTRADFGLLKPLIARLIQTEILEVRIFVTGTHLDADFGMTVGEIEKEFPHHIFYRVSQNMQEDPKLKNVKVMSEVLLKYAEALSKDPVDMAVILGDRYEALCFGLACASLSVPFAHLHGGELTLGAIDDKFRHCLTKLAHWHFVACESYRKRVIQLGESPATVFNVGALGVENALHQKVMTLPELAADLGVPLQNFKEIYLFTFHPETNSPDYGASLLRAFLKKLGERLVQNQGLVVITGINSDAGAHEIRKILSQFQHEMKDRVFAKESLGLIRYLSMMKLATAVLGNSSSGILEAFSLRTPTVNIGKRQAGRERESSVIDLDSELDCAQFDFRKLADLKKQLMTSSEVPSIFGHGGTSVQIAHQLESLAQSDHFEISKEFFDLP
jgi:GDP/UDP-N,N'-diacetylbacillosamine 2-epimerase (hydrolysing)